MAILFLNRHHLIQSLKEGIKYLWIKLRTASFTENLVRFFVGEGLLIWTLADECVEYVGNGTDSTKERDVLSSQTFRVPATVPLFVVGQGNDLACQQQVR